MRLNHIYLESLGVRLGRRLDLADAVADGRYPSGEYTANGLLGVTVSDDAFAPDLAVDAVFAATPPPPPGDDWRADVTTLLTERRAALLRPPWSAGMRRRPAVGPGFLSWMEFLQATLTRAGFTSRDVTAASWVLYSHVQGSAASQATLRWSAAERREGQLMLERHSASYPTLAAQRHLLDDDWDTNFALGLAYVLDGLTARAAAGAT